MISLSVGEVKMLSWNTRVIAWPHIAYTVKHGFYISEGSVQNECKINSM